MRSLDTAGDATGQFRREQLDAMGVGFSPIHKGFAVVHNAFIGTAGWSLNRDFSEFQGGGTALERYAAVFSATEVNSSFHRRHRPSTWQRWHDSVPQNFKFSVKLPKTITHQSQLIDPETDLDEFFADIAPLGSKLAAILVQLPPKLAFQRESASAFFSALQARSPVPVYLEPRHATWANAEASELLQAFKIARVYADPQQEGLRAAALADGATYLRLHGSPKIYYSEYDHAAIELFAALLRAGSGPGWCIFDNTASGAALRDAFKLRDIIAEESPASTVAATISDGAAGADR
ncbi:DUF72 domain-containing protein [Devosia sp. 1566]|uniref:DUF72 domain-containing protein n=1 Tax=Devosia sp. 1566 TaxID=2499144 RepID=UPI0019D0BBB0|nr:DUF72 domain-containing protein [Devosia sp. 1566]